MRILVVDENLERHGAYRKAFDTFEREVRPTSSVDAEPIEKVYDELPQSDWEVIFCANEEDAFAAVNQANLSGTDLAVAFVNLEDDLTLDGTVGRLRRMDPDLNLILVSEKNDLSPVEIREVAGPADKVLCLSGPLRAGAIVQAAINAEQRRRVDRELSEARAALARQVLLLEEQALELAANESRALYLASHDPLTEAPNRLAFLRALADRARHPGTFAIASLDIDRFKLINDALGHVTGDEVVREACRLVQSLAPAGAFVARLAGDEYGLLFDTAGQEAAVMACERVVAGCDTSLRVLGHDVHITVSAGVVVFEDGDTSEPTDLMRKADLALNDAKRRGRNLARLFESALDDSIRVRRTVQDGLSQAIARDELGMLFQPIVVNGSGQIAGFEALLRWYNDDIGPISPAAFIPIAEESDLIHELGDWVLSRSLEALREWPRQYVSVNFSPRQFRRPNFIGYVMEKVQRAGIDPSRFQIEITETAIFDDVERASETLYRLRQMGFRVALDDFGTGYSNLYNIRKFALDALKIDRSFIDGMMRERESAAIVRSIAELGRALKLEVIAEGVETEGQVALLRAAGVSHLQGFLFAHPLRAEDARLLAGGGYLQHERHIAALVPTSPVQDAAA